MELTTIPTNGHHVVEDPEIDFIDCDFERRPLASFITELDLAVLPHGILVSWSRFTVPEQRFLECSLAASDVIRCTPPSRTEYTMYMDRDMTIESALDITVAPGGETVDLNDHVTLLCEKEDCAGSYCEATQRGSARLVPDHDG